MEVRVGAGSDDRQASEDADEERDALRPAGPGACEEADADGRTEARVAASPEGKKSKLPLHEPRLNDGPAVAEWRQRMGTDQAKQIYKQRGATVECVNAIARNRGLRSFLVRGLKAAKTVALIFAIAHNVVRTITLTT